MLKFEVDSVPEGMDKFYTKDETSGKFMLQVDGLDDVKSTRTKVNQFRTENIALRKQLEEFAEFEQVTEAEGKGTKEGVKNTIEALVNNRTTQMRTAHETALAEKDKALAAATARLEQVLIADAVRAAALDHGVVKTGVDDVLARAGRMFKVVDGNVKSVDNAGDDKGNPLTISSFVSSLKTSAPHLFAQSEGTGSFSRSRSSTPSTTEKSRGARLAEFAKK
jgi:hypothetical protein